MLEAVSLNGIEATETTCFAFTVYFFTMCIEQRLSSIV